jgi:hypothetical protein
VDNFVENCPAIAPPRPSQALRIGNHSHCPSVKFI